MRIGTYNVLGLQGHPPEEARKALGGPETEATAAHFQRVFAELDCDLLALQEGVPDRQIHRISRALGCHAATFPSPINWPGHLLTRYPILESRIFGHAGPNAESSPFSRTAGAALLQRDDNTRLWVMVLHLHPSLRHIRDREASLVRDRLAPLLTDTENVLVLGDFNCPVDEPVHHYLKAAGFVNAMEAAGGGLAPTMDTAGKPLETIDHIYLSLALAPHLTHAEVIRRPGYRDDTLREGTWVHSDHLPIVAEVLFPHDS